MKGGFVDPNVLWGTSVTEVAHASDLQGSNFESFVWRTVSSHHPEEVLLAQFSLYVHKSGLRPDSFHLDPNGHIGSPAGVSGLINTGRGSFSLPFC